MKTSTESRKKKPPSSWLRKKLLKHRNLISQRRKTKKASSFAVTKDVRHVHSQMKKIMTLLVTFTVANLYSTISRNTGHVATQMVTVEKIRLHTTGMSS